MDEFLEALDRYIDARIEYAIAETEVGADGYTGGMCASNRRELEKARAVFSDRLAQFLVELKEYANEL